MVVGLHEPVATAHESLPERAAPTLDDVMVKGRSLLVQRHPPERVRLLLLEKEGYPAALVDQALALIDAEDRAVALQKRKRVVIGTVLAVVAGLGLDWLLGTSRSIGLVLLIVVMVSFGLMMSWLISSARGL